MSFVITSYFTLDTDYQAVAHKYLMPSLSNLIHKQPIRSDVQGIQNLGSWQANTTHKPTFIKQMLERHKDLDVVFVDCDAEVLQYPTLFDNIPLDYSIAVHLLDRDKWYNRDLKEEKELLSGTLFIRNSEAGHQIVDKWIQLCKNFPHVWEQGILQRVIKENNIPVFELPIDYCYISSMPNGSKPYVQCENPVVIHHQVSRNLKNKIR